MSENDRHNGNQIYRKSDSDDSRVTCVIELTGGNMLDCGERLFKFVKRIRSKFNDAYRHDGQIITVLLSKNDMRMIPIGNIVQIHVKFLDSRDKDVD